MKFIKGGFMKITKKQARSLWYNHRASYSKTSFSSLVKEMRNEVKRYRITSERLLKDGNKIVLNKKNNFELWTYGIYNNPIWIQKNYKLNKAYKNK